MKTIIDTTSDSNPIEWCVNTNIGRVIFHTNVGNKYEVVSRIKQQNNSVTFCDTHHASCNL